MNFFSVTFFFFLLFILLLYYLVGKKTVIMQNIILLISNFIFYSMFDMRYVIVLFTCIVLTYFGGILANNIKCEINRKRILKIFLCFNFLILIIFKYTIFMCENVNRVFQLLNVRQVIEIPNMILPIGLSFYIFQSSSYLFDLILKKREVERDFIAYACYVSFFSTIVSGPILKSYKYVDLFKKRRNFSYKFFQYGFYYFIWGCFAKYMISDRIALLVDYVWNNFQDYDGIILAISALFYSLQIYTDFLGYSYMAMGVGYLLGFSLPYNFYQPYFACSIADFWRRWHISLTSWLREYIYIPLGGNRRGKIRKYLNITAVFLISGIWHGASWKFVIWGGLHSIYQICGELLLPIREKICQLLQINRNAWSFHLSQRISVYLLTSFAWIFFRSPSLKSSIEYIEQMIHLGNGWVLLDGTLNQIGLSAIEWHILWISLLILMVVSILKEKNESLDFILQQNGLFRFGIAFFVTFAIVIFGVYGPTYSSSSFIYAGF